MLTFDVILEDQWTNKLTFATIEECVDIDDCINHIHEHFPSHTIEKITANQTQRLHIHAAR